MSTAAADRPRGILARMIRGSITLCAALIAALAIAVIVEWVGLSFFWPEQGAARSEAVLRQDLAWLRGSAADSIVLPLATAPAAIAADLSTRLYRTLAAWAGLEALPARLSPISSVAAVYLQAGLNSMQTFFVRLAIIVTAAPLFIVFAWWGSMEGLVRRDLRRFGGDIEHGMVYHFVKHLTGATIAVPFILYLAWPDSINPAMLFLPFAAVLGLNAMVLISNFTKYV